MKAKTKVSGDEETSTPCPPSLAYTPRDTPASPSIPLTAGIHAAASKQRELEVGARDGEGEALVVVVLVRVATCGFNVSSLIHLKSLGFSSHGRRFHVIPGALPDL